MKKWTSLVLLFSLLTLLTVPAGAIGYYTSPYPMRYAFVDLNEDGTYELFMFCDVHGEFLYAYDNGEIRRFEFAQESEGITFFMLTGVRHVQTGELRWIAPSWLAYTASEFIFDFENFSYTIIEITPEDSFWQEDFVEVFDMIYRTYRGTGSASDEIVQQLLAEQNAPTPVNSIYSDDVSFISRTWLLAAGIGGIILGAGIVLIILFIVLKRRKNAES